MHNVSIENIRAQIVRVMRLPMVSHNVPGLLFQNFSREKHTDAFPAYKARPYFSFRDIKNIHKRKILDNKVGYSQFFPDNPADKEPFHLFLRFFVAG